MRFKEIPVWAYFEVCDEAKWTAVEYRKNSFQCSKDFGSSGNNNLQLVPGFRRRGSPWRYPAGSPMKAVMISSQSTVSIPVEIVILLTSSISTEQKLHD